MYPYFNSQAGFGGSRSHTSGASADGGDATMGAAITNTGEIWHYSEIEGGSGGDASGGANGGNGGNALIVSDMTTSSGLVDTYDLAEAGDGGWISAGTGTGGNGGDAVLDVSASTTGTQDVTAIGFAYGGSGGLAYRDPNGSGGDGGEARGTISATTTTGLARVTGIYQGGSGGSVIGGSGQTGSGASVSILNQVTAVATDLAGSTFVEQSANAGDAGDTGDQNDFGTGNIGTAGSATGRLMAVNNNSDSTLWSDANAGQGGARNNTSGAAGDGGSAVSEATLENTGFAFSRSLASGGFGGGGTSGATGGAGGSADSSATATSSGSQALANSFAYGGDGGNTVDGAEQGGTAFDAYANSIAQATSTTLGEVAESESEAIAGFGKGFGNRYLSSKSGTANAEATSTTNQGQAFASSYAEGRQARAISTGDGVSGSVFASAETIRGVLGDTNDDPVQVVNTVTADVSGLTQVESIVNADGTIGSNSNADAFSIVEVTLPPSNSASSTSSLVTLPSAASPNDSSPIIHGRIGGNYPTGASGPVNAMIETTFTFANTVDASRAIIIWDGLNAVGDGFDTLNLSIGTQTSTRQWNFANLSEAQSFFGGGPITVDDVSETNDAMTMQVSWSSSAATDGFAIGFSTSITAVPEPSAAFVLFVTAIGCVATRRKRPCRR